MIVKDILEVIEEHTDIKIFSEGKGFSINGQAGEILKGAHYILHRKVALVEIYQSMVCSPIMAITLVSEEENDK